VISFRADLKIMLAAQPVDFRKSVHTLSALVSEALRANPYCGDVFIFRSKRRTALNFWRGTAAGPGDQVARGRPLHWPPIRDGVVSLTATQPSMLVDGLDWARVTPKSVKRPAGLM
jgi:transposase